MNRMDANEAISIYKLLEENGVSITIDGGWGIDALIGKQTRNHADLDIALEHKYVPALRKVLEQRGYSDTHRMDSKEFNFVLADDKGHEIDVHSYTFDAKGNNIYGIAYPIESLTGKGQLNGFEVRCITLEYVIQFHENYEPDEEDLQDIKALIEKFNIKPPKNYKI